MGVGVRVMGRSLSTTKNVTCVRSDKPVMAGLGGGPQGPVTLYTWAGPRLPRVETPFPAPPPHWGHPGRLHRCWHPNEKVNIEPKDWGGGGGGVGRAAGSPQGGSSCLGPAWLPQGLPKGKGHPQPRGVGVRDWGTGREKLWGLLAASTGR